MQCYACHINEPTAQLKNIVFHLFPKDEDLRQKWIDAIGCENINLPTNASALCSLHFDGNCLFYVIYKNRKTLLLRPGAVPAKFGFKFSNNWKKALSDHDYLSSSIDNTPLRSLPIEAQTHEKNAPTIPLKNVAIVNKDLNCTLEGFDVRSDTSQNILILKPSTPEYQVQEVTITTSPNENHFHGTALDPNLPTIDLTIDSEDDEMDTSQQQSNIDEVDNIHYISSDDDSNNPSNVTDVEKQKNNGNTANSSRTLQNYNHRFPEYHRKEDMSSPTKTLENWKLAVNEISLLRNKVLLLQHSNRRLKQRVKEFKDMMRQIILRKTMAILDNTSDVFTDDTE